MSGSGTERRVGKRAASEVVGASGATTVSGDAEHRPARGDRARAALAGVEEAAEVAAGERLEEAVRLRVVSDEKVGGAAEDGVGVGAGAEPVPGGERGGGGIGLGEEALELLLGGEAVVAERLEGDADRGVLETEVADGGHLRARVFGAGRERRSGVGEPRGPCGKRRDLRGDPEVREDARGALAEEVVRGDRGVEGRRRGCGRTARRAARRGAGARAGAGGIERRAQLHPVRPRDLEARGADLALERPRAPRAERLPARCRAAAGCRCAARPFGAARRAALDGARAEEVEGGGWVQG